jgi:hypothetical protein
MRIDTGFAIALTAALLVGCGGAGLSDPSGSAALPAADVASAQRLVSPDETLQTLDFPRVGSTGASGTVDGYRHTSYLVPIAKGQTLTVTLESPSTNAYFNVHDAADSSGFAIFNGNSGERTARLTASEDMTYVIRPFQPRASARRNEQVPYSLAVERK